MRKSQFRKPYRVKKKKPIWKMKLFWRIFIFFVFFGEVFYSVYFLIPFQIKKIVISGNEKIGTTDLENFVENQINKEILSFSTRSIFLVNSMAIEKALLATFPQIDEVMLEKKFFSGLAASIKERKPVAAFDQSGQDFFADKEGIVFELSRGENQLLRIKISEDRPLLKLGERVLDKKTMAAILEIEEMMERELKIPLREVLIDSEEKLVVKTVEGWEAYFNPQKEIGWQLTKLKAVLEKEISETRRKILEYVDVRFSNLAPYK